MRIRLRPIVLCDCTHIRLVHFAWLWSLNRFLALVRMRLKVEQNYVIRKKKLTLTSDQGREKARILKLNSSIHTQF